MTKKGKAQTGSGRFVSGEWHLAGFAWHELFLWGVALIPLVWMPQILDLYDMPKRIVLNALVLCFLGVHAIACARETGSVLFAGGPLLAPTVAYLAAMTLASVKALNGADALDGWLQQGMPAILAMAMLARGLSEAAFQRFVSWAIGAGIVATIVGLVQYYGFDTDPLGIRQVVKPASIFGNKNMAAEYILTILPLVLYRLELQRFRGWCLAPLAAIIAFIFVGRTRTVWVAAGTILAVVAVRVWLTPKIRQWAWEARWHLVSCAIGAVIIVCLPWIWGGGAGLDTVASAASGAAGSLRVRLALWANSIPMLARDPILGVGPNNWYIEYPKYAFTNMVDISFSTSAQAEHPHNDLVQVAGETGLVGLAAFVWILWTIVRVAWKSMQGLFDESSHGPGRQFYISLTLFAIFLDGTFAYPLHLAPCAGYFWVFSAFLIALAPHVEVKPRRLPGGILAAALVVLGALLLMSRDYKILSSNYHYRLAAIAMASNDWKSAEKSLRSSLQYDSSRYRQHSVLGRALVAQGRAAEATEEYKAALTCHPNQINVLYNFSHAVRSLGKLDEAIAILQRSLEIVPRFAEGLYLMGNYLKEKGQREKALEHFKKVLEINDSHPDALNEVGNMLKDQRRFDEATVYYQRALKAKPDYGEVHNNLGVVFLEQQKFKEAVPRFEKAIELAPAYPGSYFNLARSLTGLGRTTEAIDYYKQFLDRWTGDEQTRESAKAEIRRLGGKI